MIRKMRLQKRLVAVLIVLLIFLSQGSMIQVKVKAAELGNTKEVEPGSTEAMEQGYFSDSVVKAQAAATTTSVGSVSEFYNKLAEQIQNRETLKYYKITNSSIIDPILNMNFEDFEFHYREDAPLMSGCYLGYYVDVIYFTYNRQGLKVLIKFPYNIEEMDKHFEQMKQLAETLKGKTDFQTILNVHDYLIENFEYDHRSEMKNHTDIDGFRDKEMVCTGYSLAAYYLLNSAGIKTRVVTGDGSNNKEKKVNHMWNVVLLDGQWYNLDITWDDGGGSKKHYTYFLKSDSDFPMHERMGGYSTGAFNVKIAPKSYKLPLKLSIGINEISGLLLVLVFIAAFIARKKRNAQKPQGPVILYEEVIDAGPEDVSAVKPQSSLIRESGTEGPFTENSGDSYREGPFTENSEEDFRNRYEEYKNIK